MEKNRPFSFYEVQKRKSASKPLTEFICVCLSMRQTFDLGALMTDATRETEFDITYTIFQALKAGS